MATNVHIEIGDEELIDIEAKLGSMVARYTVAIHRIAPDDNRDPPGDLHGTAAFIELDDSKYLLTCEHVTNYLSAGELCISLRRNSEVFTLVNPVSALLAPADIAIVGISENDWGMGEHDSKCIKLDQLAKHHAPVAGEWMYLSGYPGELSHTWPSMPNIENPDQEREPGQQHFTAISLMCQIQSNFEDALSSEQPTPLEDMHFLLPYTPEHAEYKSEGSQKTLPLAPGLSGSLVWNTRYIEVTSSGREWQPEDARITGIVWGGSSKGGVLVATPVEYIWQLLDLTRSNMKANLPYWTAPQVDPHPLPEA
ncbi:MAG: hypothetical protein KKC24_11485 [Gammaproteobacteria bacterium]|nr:hypothetical protein [Gammaproteobacteria bacterium]MBU0819463.1 hypothetical protein [Gammaproteobacteria bacterium]MBU0843393.1 hypothetical protein [Gammaproteobacteria bacterium]MBU1838630.1 hypothetical protein [Gammaproteobacteria bacterium]MDF9881452.1 hypothetical protein [Pseudomonas silensiensis]